MEFVTPPNHVDFLAKKMFDRLDQEVLDGSIAYIKPQGGGPTAAHTHGHNHLFIVVRGEALIRLGEEERRVKVNESILVRGKTPHSVWNAGQEETVMIGITTRNLTPEKQSRAE